MIQTAVTRSTHRRSPSRRSSGEDQIDSNAPILNGQDLTLELERLRKEKISTIYKIEAYKKRISLAIVFALFGFAVAIAMVAWRFSPIEPSWEEMRRTLLNTPEEKPNKCITVYPNVLEKEFNVNETREPLMLTPYLWAEKYQEAAIKARVSSIIQTETSYSGFLTVNQTYNNSLFFWFFPAQSKASAAPLVLWLQGGPGWPSMYGLFKENGPYLIGWDDQAAKPALLKNIYSWTQNHNMLYIDNPAGTGFSFSQSPTNGLPETDEQIGRELLEALRQFMLLYPYMISGVDASQTPVYAFGESYGGAYVVSLAHVYLHMRENNKDFIKNIMLKGLGIGNGFVAPEYQSIYTEYVNSIAYLTEKQNETMSRFDRLTLEAIKEGKDKSAQEHSNRALWYFSTEIMNLTNIYDFTHDTSSNFLTNHEYVCYLQDPQVRRAIHAGNANFHKGEASFRSLKTIMTSKQPWLTEALRRGLEVMIYNGNLDVIVNIPGTNKVVNSLQWSGKGEFVKSKRKDFWVYNERSAQPELAGYVNEGGGLTYAIVRNAGHMVPISQPLWAWKLVTQFTHYPASKRWQKPAQLNIPRGGAKFYNCP